MLKSLNIPLNKGFFVFFYLKFESIIYVENLIDV